MLIDQGPGYRQTVKKEGDLHVFKTQYFDKESLAINDRIRKSGMLNKAELGLHDDADIRMAISFPSVVLFSAFKKKHPDIYEMLHSKDEAVRMRGAKQLQLVHPEYCVYDRL